MTCGPSILTSGTGIWSSEDLSFCTLQVALGDTPCPKPNWQPYCLQEGVEAPLVGTQDPQDPAFVPKCLTWAPWIASWDVPFTHAVVQGLRPPRIALPTVADQRPVLQALFKHQYLE